MLHVYQAKVNTDVQPVFIRSLKGKVLDLFDRSDRTVYI